MSLDNESREAMIAYRQEKADVALDDALFLTDAGRYNLAANRLYYALYYQASFWANYPNAFEFCQDGYSDS